jgi:hypothetical protein
MSVGRNEVEPGKVPFARFEAQTYSTMPEGLVMAMTAAQVGRNGWSVMIALCRMIYSNGAFGRVSAKEISARTGLTANQVRRGMEELRDKGLIVPVIHRTEDGRRILDRSCQGHVAQYCITKDVWASVSLDSGLHTNGPS